MGWHAFAELKYMADFCKAKARADENMKPIIFQGCLLIFIQTYHSTVSPYRVVCVQK